MEDLHSGTQIHGRSLMTAQEFVSQLNTWGKNKTPFFFLTDFELVNLQAWMLDEIKPEEMLFDFNGFTNNEQTKVSAKIAMRKSPLSFSSYLEKYDKVYRHLCYGNSFLTNLTIKTPIHVSCSLKDIFQASKAKYKLWIKDKLVVFSPESFVKIADDAIHSFPMKGTIDASISDAKNKILSNAKELAEHVTIVDLIRNDLSTISDQVTVTRFRYVDEIKALDKTLLQVSSEITGQLAKDYQSHLGDILISLLPAGSVSGAPKAKTVEIIKEAEGENRGYFTGVAGYFNGEILDSAVLIRFIEQKGDDFFYRSGGGITTQSNAVDEYKEAIAKIYVPVY